MKKKFKLVVFNKYIILLLIIFMILVTGTTYSYLAYNYQNDSVIKGQVVSVNVDLSVELVVGSNKGMVPMKDEGLADALKGTGGESACVDANGNLSCQVYKITLTNKGSKIKNLKGIISLYNKDDDSYYENLKWRELSNETTVKSDSKIHGMANSTLMRDLTLASGETKDYYIAVYVQENDKEQNYNFARGRFSGTVTVKTSNGLDTGDYVKMTPTKSSYTTDKSMTGYTETQTINPQELNLWRVINLNDDGTVDVISEHTSTTNVFFSKMAGYQNFVGYLNVLASQYENSTYTKGSRYFGYNGQTEYITDTSKLTIVRPWTCNTDENCTHVESQGGGDMLYQKDYDLVKNALGTFKTTDPTGNKIDSYWVASRYYYQYSTSDSTGDEYYGREIYNTFFQESELNYSAYYGAMHSHDSSYSNPGWRVPTKALRPIVTLKSGLKYSGLGTEEDPYTLSVS